MPSSFQITLMMGPVTFQPVPRAVLDSLLKVQVTNSAGERSGFQLTFSFSKGTEMEKKLSSGYFDPPSRVVIVATINGQPNVIMDGVITRHELQMSNEPGQSTLTITGMDLTQVMDMVDFSFMVWPAMPREARVAIILAKYAAYGIVHGDPQCDDGCIRAGDPRAAGYGLRICPFAGRRRRLHVLCRTGVCRGPELRSRIQEIKFGAPQRALTVSSGHVSNVDAMTFSFDGFAKTLYLLYIHNKETKVSFPVPNSGHHAAQSAARSQNPNPAEGALPEPREGRGARTRWRSTLRCRPRPGPLPALTSGDVISASGSLDVPRYGGILKARSLVGVRGAGAGYDGYYFVKSVTHSIQRGQYKQSFSLTRNARAASPQRCWYEQIGTEILWQIPRYGDQQHRSDEHGPSDGAGAGRFQGLTPSSWAMPCFPFTGKQMGFWALPQIGTGVWVEFEQGDPNSFHLDGLLVSHRRRGPGTRAGGAARRTQHRDSIPGAKHVHDQRRSRTHRRNSFEDHDRGVHFRERHRNYDFNGKGATIMLQGPQVIINMGALVVI